MFSVTDARELTDQAPEGVAVIDLALPEHNAWHAGALEAFALELTSQANTRKWRALIISGGEDSHFCSGTAADADRSLVALTRLARIYSQAFSALRRYPGLIVAAINGATSDEGLALALCCDFRVSSPAAEFGFSPMSRNRIPMGGSTQLLPRLVGESLAKRMMLCGHRLNAEQALACGLVDEVVASDQRQDLLTRSVALVAPSCDHDPVVVHGVRQLIEHARMRPLETGFAAERDWQATLADMQKDLDGH